MTTDKLRRNSAALARYIVVCIAFGLATAVCHAQAPSDIVPLGDITYDLLGSLAASGKLSGYTLRDFARGDRLYTRDEIASILIRGLPEAPLDHRFAVAERILFERFAPELHHADLNRFALSPRIPAGSGDLGGWIKARLLTDPTAVTGIGRFSAVVPFGQNGYAAVSGGNWRDEWFSQNGQVAPGRYGAIETAFAHMDGRVLNLTVGEMPVRWGPGYSGALLIGDQAPSIPQVAVDKTFMLPGYYGRHLGRLAFNEFLGQFSEPNDPSAAPDAQGTNRYLIGRRLTAQGGPWSFSVAEAMKSTHLPDPEWAAVLPLYLYQNDWTEDRKQHFIPFLATHRETDTYWKNYQGDADVGYRLGGSCGTLLYTGFLVDDVKSPKGVGNGYPTTQKLGEQYGIYLPHIGGEASRFGARFEYTTVDPATYTNESPPVEWDVKGLPLGYPSGPNADVIFTRVDAAVSDKVRLALEGETRRDRGAPLAGFASASEDRIGAYATYSLSRNAFLGARFDHLRAADDGAADVTTNRAEVNAAVGF